MGEQPKRTTQNEDVSAYQAERTEFLKHRGKFEYGFKENGLPAVNSLRSMHVILCHSTYAEKNAEGEQAFLSRLLKLRIDLNYLSNLQGQKKPDGSFVIGERYIALISALEDCELEHLRIKRECGFG